MSYRFVVEERAFRFFASAKARDRRLLDKCFQMLESNPFKEGSLKDVDDDGRTLEIIEVGAFPVPYRADHAVKKLRLVGIEKVQL